jgi:hypothetical protein
VGASRREFHLCNTYTCKPGFFIGCKLQFWLKIFIVMPITWHSHWTMAINVFFFTLVKNEIKKTIKSYGCEALHT